MRGDNTSIVVILLLAIGNARLYTAHSVDSCLGFFDVCILTKNPWSHHTLAVPAAFPLVCPVFDLLTCLWFPFLEQYLLQGDAKFEINTKLRVHFVGV